MKKVYPLLFLAFLLTAQSPKLSAQCKGFAKKLCKLELLPDYIHDGNYHAAILTEGEEAELYKTFYSGQKYRIAVCSASESIPNVEFQIIDGYKNVLYDNRTAKLASVWDFVVESSQQLKIAIKVPVRDPNAEYPTSGCVAIMFGFQETVATK